MLIWEMAQLQCFLGYTAVHCGLMPPAGISMAFRGDNYSCTASKRMQNVCQILYFYGSFATSCTGSCHFDTSQYRQLLSRGQHFCIFEWQINILSKFIFRRQVYAKKEFMWKSLCRFVMMCLKVCRFVTVGVFFYFNVVWNEILVHMPISLQWRHNDHDCVWSHQPHGCLLNRLFRRRSKKTSKLRVTGLCVGNSPGPVNSPHKGPVTRKMFPFDDVIMIQQPSGDAF